MKLLDKILLATDFSQGSDTALQMSSFVAKTFNSKIILIHVIPKIQDPTLAPEKVKKSVRKKLHEIKVKLDREAINVAEPLVANGIPFDKIIEQADVNDVNVILIGFGEKASERKFRLGITAERLIRHSNKPVWVIKQGTKPRIKRILCPVDFSNPATRALTNAIHLARNFQAELTVLTVIHQMSQLYPGMGKVEAKEQKAYAKQEKSLFEKFLQKFDFYRIPWNKLVKQGKPHQEILKVARETECDLIVMGSTGRTKLKRMLLGSVAETVTREVPCSIITVKSEHAIRLQLEEEIDVIKTECDQGLELLEKGFPAEAVQRFHSCITKDKMYALAWEGLAASHKRLGHDEESKKCMDIAKSIRQDIWEKQVTAEVRKQRWGKKP